nr:penicillin-binding protein 2 [candidate division Zixibacteria bacterium]
MKSFFIGTDLREKIGGAFVILALLAVIGGLVYHQVLKHRMFQEQSESNRIRIQPVIPKRGLVYDRNLQVIADNRLSFTVSLVPFERVKDVTLPRLSVLLEMDEDDIEKRAKANFISRYIPSPIKRGLGIDIISILEEQGQSYPGITYSAESVRRYADSLSAATFIGHIGEVSPEEIKSGGERDYRLGSLVGKQGIEKTYDRLLRGIEGTEFIEVSARGQIVGPYEGKEKTPAVPGNDLILTIDRDLQRFIVSQFDSLDYSGAVVAMDPRTGDILGLASFPDFDANIFSGVIAPEIWEQIVSDSNHPLLNRPLTGLYPPGSTAKLITAGAALELGLVTEEYLLKPCFGGMQFGNRFFKCWERGGHGKLNMVHAIEQSCDVYFYQLGQMMGVDAWGEYARRCGFGKKTSIDLPGELAGIVPNSAYYDKLYGPHKWTPYLVLNLAIGQGEFTITPLQLAQFYCGLANEGKVYRPHLLKEIIHPDGSHEDVAPVLSFTLPFSKKTMTILTEALELVVQGERGTARGLRNKYYNISGKTGTAQNPHGEDHSWFAAFAPSDDPRIVVVALVENAGHGSEVAAPIAGRIMRYYLTQKDSMAASNPPIQDGGE